MKFWNRDVTDVGGGGGGGGLKKIVLHFFIDISKSKLLNIMYDPNNVGNTGKF